MSEHPLLGDFIDASVGDQATARRLLEAHPQLKDARRLHGETPLHFLAIEGFADAVRFLARLGFDVNAQNRFGDTALVDCVTLKSATMVQTLLELGANPNGPSPTQGVPLRAAVAAGHLLMVELLLRAGADADADDLEDALLEVGDPRTARELRRLLFGPSRRPSDRSSC